MMSLHPPFEELAQAVGKGDVLMIQYKYLQSTEKIVLFCSLLTNYMVLYVTVFDLVTASFCRV